MELPIREEEYCSEESLLRRRLRAKRLRARQRLREHKGETGSFAYLSPFSLFVCALSHCEMEKSRQGSRFSSRQKFF